MQKPLENSMVLGEEPQCVDYDSNTVELAENDAIETYLNDIMGAVIQDSVDLDAMANVLAPAIGEMGDKRAYYYERIGQLVVAAANKVMESDEDYQRELSIKLDYYSGR